MQTNYTYRLTGVIVILVLALVVSGVYFFHAGEKKEDSMPNVASTTTKSVPSIDAAHLVQLAGATPDPLSLTANKAGTYTSASGDFPGGVQEITCVTGAQVNDTFPKAEHGTIVRGSELACAITSDTNTFPGKSNPATVANTFHENGFSASVANH